MKQTVFRRFFMPADDGAEGPKRLMICQIDNCGDKITVSYFCDFISKIIRLSRCWCSLQLSWIRTIRPTWNDMWDGSIRYSSRRLQMRNSMQRARKWKTLPRKSRKVREFDIKRNICGFRRLHFESQFEYFRTLGRIFEIEYSKGSQSNICYPFATQTIRHRIFTTNTCVIHHLTLVKLIFLKYQKFTTFQLLQVSPLLS